MKNVFRNSVKSICAVLLLAQFNMQAQETASLNETEEVITLEKSLPDSYIVKGVVLDHENLPLGGANIVLKGTAEGIVADIDGKFEWPDRLKIDDVLVFSYLGYKPQEYVITENENELIEITIQFDYSNISLMGAVDVKGAYSSKRNIFQKFADLFKK